MTGLQSSCSSDAPVENMETLRQILENLITLSFDQEELINNISSLPKNSNSIIKYIKKQKETKGIILRLSKTHCLLLAKGLYKLNL